MVDGPIIHFFAGKGGAGKTTLACANALSRLEDNGKARILLLSLEKNGGLGDLLKKSLSSKPLKLQAGKGNGGVFAAEVDVEALAESFAGPWKTALSRSVSKGAVMSEDDLRKIFEMAAPHLGEVALLFHFQALLESGEWDGIVVDGQSTTYAMRQLEHAASLRRVVGLIRGERTSGRASKNAQRPPMAVDEFAVKCDAVNALLRDANRFQVHVVTLAEPIAETQTKQFLKFLQERTIPIHEIVVNMIEDGKGSRETANRRGLQAPHVRKYQSLHPRVDLVLRRIVGPRGIDEVRKFAKEWSSGKENKALQFAPAEAPPALVRAPSMPPIAAPPLPPTRFIFFVGTGGVGKSSCAAAAAVTLTEKEGPVLLISVDPAHSLSDVVLSRLTDTETQVKGTKGLYAREIDIAGWFNSFKKKLKEAVEPIFGPEQKSEPFSLDKDLFRNLLEAAPVGVDDLAALFTLTDALVQERFKRIVIDPAASTNTLRIIELPALMMPWLNVCLTVANKYKNKGSAQLVTFLEGMLRHLERFERAVGNPTECRFVVVTRGEELGIPSTERLVEYFKERKLPVERVLVNRVLPKTTCEITEERRNNELEVAKQVEKKIGLQVTLAPALGRHPAGLRELKAFRTSWYALTAAGEKTKAA
jgi:arsenite-transporting ATPase